jgi:hypothetical protein
MYLCEILFDPMKLAPSKEHYRFYLRSIYKDPKFHNFNSIEAFTNATLPIYLVFKKNLNGAKDVEYLAF